MYRKNNNYCYFKECRKASSYGGKTVEDVNYRGFFLNFLSEQNLLISKIEFQGARKLSGDETDGKKVWNRGSRWDL